MSTLSLVPVVQAVTQQFRELTGLADCTVVAMAAEDGGWQVAVEAVERPAIPASQDLIGQYTVRADAHGSIQSFARSGLRRRGDTR